METRKRFSDLVLKDIFQQALDGASYASIASKQRTTKDNLIEQLSEYRPYKKWLADRRRSPSLRYDDLRVMLTRGFTTRHIAELFQLSYDELKMEIHRLENADKRKYITDPAAEESKRVITVYDVEIFKEIVQIGELLKCDKTEDGIVIWCKVLKKHKWFATTDCGCQEWNWLCVQNPERYFDNEIIYGR